MLTECEDGLIACIKASALGKRLHTVAGLPDLDGKSLVTRFAAEAPAVYVAPASFAVADGAASPRFGLACVAKNSRSQEAARKGDGKAIGMNQIAEGVASLLNGGKAGDVSWRVLNIEFAADELLIGNGLHVAVVRVEAAGVELPPALDESALADFATFRASYDFEPHTNAGEHAKWAGDPPDHTTSAPDVTEIVTLQP